MNQEKEVEFTTNQPIMYEIYIFNLKKWYE